MGRGGRSVDLRQGLKPDPAGKSHVWVATGHQEPIRATAPNKAVPLEPGLRFDETVIPVLRSAIRLKIEGSRFVREVKEQHVLPTDGRLTIIGPDPLRVLLFGGDYATGTNVRSRKDALDGAIAELLHAQTGRGIIVENRSYPEMPLDRLVSSLGATGAHTFDLVIWCPTFSEAVRRPLARTWQSALADVIRFLRSTSSAGIVLLGIPDLLGPAPLAQLARARAHTLNAAIARAAAEYENVLTVNPPPVNAAMVAETDGSKTYQHAAQALAPAIERLLSPARSVIRSNSAKVPA